LLKIENKNLNNSGSKPLKDLTSLKVNRLLVIDFAGRDGNKRNYWNCKCDCGNITLVRQDNLINGVAKSCGCRQLETVGMRGWKHGVSNTRIVKILYGMICRCHNPKTPYYKYYGGRGIKVCDEWQHDSKVFYDWAINNGYKDGLSIDRINNDGNYEPNNCRWATQKEQINNKRQTQSQKYITYNDKTLNLSEWSKVLNISVGVLGSRVWQGWDDERVVSTPLGYDISDRMVNVNGENMNLTQAVKSFGAVYETVRSRLSRGLSIDESLNRPLGAHKLVNIDGNIMCLIDATKYLGIPYRTFRWRVQHGWTKIEALMIPSYQKNKKYIN